MPTDAEIELLFRWNNRAHTAVDDAMEGLRAARARLLGAKQCIVGTNLEEAERIHERISDGVLEAVGNLLHMEMPGVSAAELARRAFFSASVRGGKGADPDLFEWKPGILKSHDARSAKEELAAQTGQVLGAGAVNKITSTEVLEAMVADGVDAEFVGTYLAGCFKKTKTSGVTTKADVFKMWLRFMEHIEGPTLTIDTSRLDEIPDEELEAMQTDLMEDLGRYVVERQRKRAGLLKE